MKTSREGIELIKRHEGCVLRAYDDFEPWNKDLTDVKGTLTIGYGHTGDDVFIGQVITQDEAEYFLRKDLGWSEEAVEDLFDHFGWMFMQNRFDALVSWVYNTGAGNLKDRSLVSAIDNLNLVEATDKDDTEARDQVGYWWNKYYITSKGVKLEGLVKRRKEESDIFLSQIIE